MPAAARVLKSRAVRTGQIPVLNAAAPYFAPGRLAVLVASRTRVLQVSFACPTIQPAVSNHFGIRCYCLHCIPLGNDAGHAPLLGASLWTRLVRIIVAFHFITRRLKSSNFGPSISDSSLACSGDFMAYLRNCVISGDVAPASNNIPPHISFSSGC